MLPVLPTSLRSVTPTQIYYLGRTLYVLLYRLLELPSIHAHAALGVSADPFTLPKPVGILGEIEQHTHIY